MTAQVLIDTKSQPFHIKYRPSTFDQVIGQSQTVASIQSILESHSVPHTFMLTGPAGCGKTSTALLIAKALGCVGSDIIELDAATHGDVENIRELTEMMKYVPMQGQNKCLILDEVHNISKKAFESLLKSIEQPPAHAFYILATTEETKIPATIKTRCHAYTFREVSAQELYELAYVVNELEALQRSEEMLRLVAENSNGSPRQMLVNLSTIRHANTLQDASVLLKTNEAEETSGLIQIMRMILKNDLNWTQLMEHAKTVENWGGMRAIFRGYISKVAMGRFDGQIMRIQEALEKMPMFPNDKEGLADLQMFLYRVIASNKRD